VAAAAQRPDRDEQHVDRGEGRPLVRADALGPCPRARGGAPGQVAHEGGEVAAGARGVSGADALLELVDVEPSGAGVLAQLGDHGLALGVGRAQHGLGRAQRGVAPRVGGVRRP